MAPRQFRHTIQTDVVIRSVQCRGVRLASNRCHSRRPRSGRSGIQRSPGGPVARIPGQTSGLPGMDAKQSSSAKTRAATASDPHTLLSDQRKLLVEFGAGCPEGARPQARFAARRPQAGRPVSHFRGPRPIRSPIEAQHDHPGDQSRRPNSSSILAKSFTQDFGR